MVGKMAPAADQQRKPPKGPPMPGRKGEPAKGAKPVKKVDAMQEKQNLLSLLTKQAEENTRILERERAMLLAQEIETVETQRTQLQQEMGGPYYTDQKGTYGNNGPYGGVPWQGPAPGYVPLPADQPPRRNRQQPQMEMLQQQQQVQAPFQQQYGPPAGAMQARQQQARQQQAGQQRNHVFLGGPAKVFDPSQVPGLGGSGAAAAAGGSGTPRDRAGWPGNQEPARTPESPFAAHSPRGGRAFSPNGTFPDSPSFFPGMVFSVPVRENEPTLPRQGWPDGAAAAAPGAAAGGKAPPGQRQAGAKGGRAAEGAQAPGRLGAKPKQAGAAPMFPQQLTIVQSPDPPPGGKQQRGQQQPERGGKQPGGKQRAGGARGAAAAAQDRSPAAEQQVDATVDQMSMLQVGDPSLRPARGGQREPQQQQEQEQQPLLPGPAPRVSGPGQYQQQVSDERTLADQRKEAYRRELEEQIRLKQQMKQQEEEARRRYEEAAAGAAPPPWDPAARRVRRGGGGEPLRDVQGNAMTDLRQAYRQGQQPEDGDVIAGAPGYGAPGMPPPYGVPPPGPPMGGAPYGQPYGFPPGEPATMGGPPGMPGYDPAAPPPYYVQQPGMPSAHRSPPQLTVQIPGQPPRMGPRGGPPGAAPGFVPQPGYVVAGPGMGAPAPAPLSPNHHHHHQPELGSPGSPGAKRGYLAGLAELKPGPSDEQRRWQEAQRQQLARDLEEQIRQKKAREAEEKAKEVAERAREEAELQAYYARMNAQKDDEKRQQREQARAVEQQQQQQQQQVQQQQPQPVYGGDAAMPLGPNGKPRRVPKRLIDADWLDKPAQPPQQQQPPPPQQQPERHQHHHQPAFQEGSVGGALQPEASHASVGAPRYGRRATHDAGEGLLGPEASAAAVAAAAAGGGGQVGSLLHQLQQEQARMREDFARQTDALERLAGDASAVAAERDRAWQELGRVRALLENHAPPAVIGSPGDGEMELPGTSVAAHMGAGVRLSTIFGSPGRGSVAGFGAGGTSAGDALDHFVVSTHLVPRETNAIPERLPTPMEANWVTSSEKLLVRKSPPQHHSPGGPGNPAPYSSTSFGPGYLRGSGGGGTIGSPGRSLDMEDAYDTLDMFQRGAEFATGLRGQRGARSAGPMRPPGNDGGGYAGYAAGGYSSKGPPDGVYRPFSRVAGPPSMIPKPPPPSMLHAVVGGRGVGAGAGAMKPGAPPPSRYSSFFNMDGAAGMPPPVPPYQYSPPQQRLNDGSPRGSGEGPQQQQQMRRVAPAPIRPPPSPAILRADHLPSPVKQTQNKRASVGGLPHHPQQQHPQPAQQHGQAAAPGAAKAGRRAAAAQQEQEAMKRPVRRVQRTGEALAQKADGGDAAHDASPAAGGVAFAEDAGLGSNPHEPLHAALTSSGSAAVSAAPQQTLAPHGLPTIAEVGGSLAASPAPADSGNDGSSGPRAEGPTDEGNGAARSSAPPSRTTSASGRRTWDVVGAPAGPAGSVPPSRGAAPVVPPASEGTE